jgi:hypothetical protein
MTARWSRAAARARWAGLEPSLRATLPAGIAITALWPLGGLLLYWPTYRDPWVVAGAWAASVALPLLLVARGPRGIGPAAAAAAAATTITLTAVVGLQLDDARDGYFMNSWGVAAAVVLAFARPPEEPLAVGAGIFAVTALLNTPLTSDLQVRHIAPMAIGAALPATAWAVMVAVVLRATLGAARRLRVEAEAVEDRLATAEAVRRERRRRFARWESEIVPVLEAIAAGRRDPADAATVAECARTARLLRAELSASSESMFEALLAAQAERMRARGGELVIRDLDVGHLLQERDRIALTDRVSGLVDDGAAAVELTVLSAGATAMVVLAATGVTPPDTRPWGGTLTVAGSRQWWWDGELPLDRAPAQPFGR